MYTHSKWRKWLSILIRNTKRPQNIFFAYFLHHDLYSSKLWVWPLVDRVLYKWPVTVSSQEKERQSSRRQSSRVSWDQRFSGTVCIQNVLGHHCLIYPRMFVSTIEINEASLLLYIHRFDTSYIIMYINNDIKNLLISLIRKICCEESQSKFLILW